MDGVPRDYVGAGWCKLCGELTYFNSDPSPDNKDYARSKKQICLECEKKICKFCGKNFSECQCSEEKQREAFRSAREAQQSGLPAPDLPAGMGSPPPFGGNIPIPKPPAGRGCSLPPYNPDIPKQVGVPKSGGTPTNPASPPGQTGTLSEQELREIEKALKLPVARLDKDHSTRLVYKDYMDKEVYDRLMEKYGNIPSTPSMGGPSKTADDLADFNEIDTEGMTDEEIAALKGGRTAPNTQTAPEAPLDILPGETPQDATRRVLEETGASERDKYDRIHAITRQQLRDAPGQEIRESSDDGHENILTRLLPDGTIHVTQQKVFGKNERQTFEQYIYPDGTQVTQSRVDSRPKESAQTQTSFQEITYEVLSPDHQTCKIFSSSTSESSTSNKPLQPLSGTSATPTLLGIDALQAEKNALRQKYSHGFWDNQ